MALCALGHAEFSSSELSLKLLFFRHLPRLFEPWGRGGGTSVHHKASTCTGQSNRGSRTYIRVLSGIKAHNQSIGAVKAHALDRAATVVNLMPLKMVIIELQIKAFIV
jgi:hypothetical protein